MLTFNFYAGLFIIVCLFVLITNTRDLRYQSGLEYIRDCVLATLIWLLIITILVCGLSLIFGFQLLS